MGFLSLKIDEFAIRKKFEEEVLSIPEVKEQAEKAASNLFIRAKNSLLKNFENHEITQEIRGGNSSINLSNTLDGYGNLFSFLGFYEGSDPTRELDELLRDVEMERSYYKNNIVYFNISYPSRKQIEEATQMTWGQGTSWAYAVENGEFNGDAALSHFIFKNSITSRSQAGFQVGHEYAEEEFSPKPYISEIIENFKDRINNSRSKYIV